MTIKFHLKNLREAKGLTQQEVAEKLGVSKMTISKWENDGSGITLSNSMNLAKLYDCPLDLIFIGTMKQYVDYVDNVMKT